MFGEITHNLAALRHYTHLPYNKDNLVQHEYADA